MTSALEAYRAAFFEHVLRVRPQEPTWLSLLRRDAFERFLERGFPTTDEEDWRFTSVAPLAATSFSPAHALPVPAGSSIDEARYSSDWARHELVFVNGLFVEELSSPAALPRGVVVASLSRAFDTHADELEAVLSLPGADSGTIFSDLNLAFLDDGAFVFVPENTAVDVPIHLVFHTAASAPAVSHPRIVVLVERGARVSVVETYIGPEESVYFTNTASDVLAASGASVDHYKVQRESKSAFHVGSHRFLQARATTFSSHSLSLGARLARNDIHSLLDGEGADLTLNGLYVVGGSQHVDHHTLIDHKEPHGTSRELYKGVLDDTSSGVFNGRIIVRGKAQKTSAQQTNKNLLLSEDALVNSNPQLEIHADDVKCAHGATIGQLDKESLFYLRSRGIGLEDARNMLTRAFMADVSDRIPIASIREAMRALVFPEAA